MRWRRVNTATSAMFAQPPLHLFSCEWPPSLSGRLFSSVWHEWCCLGWLKRCGRSLGWSASLLFHCEYRGCITSGGEKQRMCEVIISVISLRISLPLCVCACASACVFVLLCLLLDVFARSRNAHSFVFNWCQGRSDGGVYRYIYPQKSVTVLFTTCVTLTHVLKLQWLVKTYTPPPKSNSWLRHWNYLRRVPVPVRRCHV